MTDQEQIKRQLRFLDINTDTSSTLRNHEELFESSIDDVLDRFYAHILKEPEIAALFEDDQSVARAREAQRRHWLKTLFTMKLGKAQFDQAGRIGRAHVGIGLVPSWYLASYCFVLNHFVELFAARFENDAAGLGRVTQALNKAIFLDINLVIESYLDAKDSAMRGILQRATVFTEDIGQLNEELSDTTTDFRAMVESNYSEGDEMDRYLRFSKRLSNQVEMLNARLEKLQFEDKLYFHRSEKENVFSRVWKAIKNQR